ncbi:MAG: hypothetical protein ACOX68_08235 [Candidatus Limivicinus sp.]|jgi:uncharacterized Zn finger protein
MKCPRCGHEMVLDGHRKYDMYMCYDCGYVEGLNDTPAAPRKTTNFERVHKMNFNEAVAFVSKGLGIDRRSLADWMDNVSA